VVNTELIKENVVLETIILIPAVEKLVANLDSIRNSIQKSDSSWCWRDLVTLKDLHSVT